MGSEQTRKETIVLTQVAERVFVHQSDLLLNNTVVVQGRTGVLVIDPGLSGAEMTCLAEDLREMDQLVVAGFATHPDWDHVLWHAALGEAPRYGTARCAEVMRAFRSQADWAARAAEGLPLEIADDVPLDLYGIITGLPAETKRLPWDGPHVRIIEHPAHAPGHAALFVEEHGVLVAGDMLSDLFVPMLDVEAAADPVGDYLAGLRMLEAVAADADVLIPGHGSVGGPGMARARIDLDRAYVHALRDGRAPHDDPRIGPSVKPGWEWISDIHTGQVRSLALNSRRDEMKGQGPILEGHPSDA